MKDANVGLKLKKASSKAILLAFVGARNVANRVTCLKEKLPGKSKNWQLPKSVTDNRFIQSIKTMLNQTEQETIIANLQPLTFYQAVLIGADPEFFFENKKSGAVVGSEKVLPAEGLSGNPNGVYQHRLGYEIVDDRKKILSKFVVDGVQAELNPNPSTCRALFGNEIARCFRQLRDELLKKHPEIAVSFAPMVKLSQEELDSLSESSKIFGCAPSANIYVKGPDKTSQIKADPKKYLGRSAGGHIHLGNGYFAYLLPANEKTYRSDDRESSYQRAVRTEKALKGDVETMVKLLDIIVGNTCVLIDRDPSNAERRKNYGRAGEHRVKEYGLEYRTISNFWLRSYPLMSFVTGMCRIAVLIAEQSTDTNNYVKALLNAVNMDDVTKAINENDFNLAHANFKKIEPILLQATKGSYLHASHPIHESTIKLFHTFVAYGIDHWFKQDPMEHWCNLPDGHGCGFEAFLVNTVAKAEQKPMLPLPVIDLNATPAASNIAVEEKPKMFKRILKSRRLRAVEEEVVA